MINKHRQRHYRLALIDVLNDVQDFERHEAMDGDLLWNHLKRSNGGFWSEIQILNSRSEQSADKQENNLKV